MPELEALARNLKLIRKVKKMNQENFAAECGICIEMLSAYECERGDPKLSTIQKIAAYVGCEVPELLKKDGNLNLNSETVLEKETIKQSFSL